MDKQTATAFYFGAAIYLDLDSPEVDHILDEHGLSVQDDTIEACRDCIWQHRPIAPPPFGPPAKPATPYLSITEAVESSGINRRTISAACLRGDIAGAFRSTRNEWRLTPAALRDWIDDPAMHRTGPKPEQETWTVLPTCNYFSSEAEAIAWLETEQDARQTGPGEWVTVDEDGDIETEWTVRLVDYTTIEGEK